ncbi:MAG TPA: prolipoprotein diacylglyceryl transferase [Blastocatellia bacterium]|nr:prolipoprotein diacylglyceryl transferase [Blastocatellia bacterium]
MFPELFKIPGIDVTIHTYGFLLAIAFILALWMTARLAARDGLPKNRVYDLGLYILLSALVGAKVVMLITEWNEPGGGWKRVFSLDLLSSGGVFYGGLLFALLTSVLLMRLYKLPWRKTADAFAPGIALGHAIGRMGCFSAGCCWGKPTDSWIGVHFTQKASELTGVPIDSALVPTQLIEAMVNVLILVFLLWLTKRRRFEGQVIFAYLMIYSVARFIIEFWRADPRGEAFGLSTSQLISVIMFPLALLLMIYYSRRNKDRSQKSEISGQKPELGNSKASPVPES